MKFFRKLLNWFRRKPKITLSEVLFATITSEVINYKEGIESPCNWREEVLQQDTSLQNEVYRAIRDVLEKQVGNKLYHIDFVNKEHALNTNMPFALDILIEDGNGNGNVLRLAYNTEGLRFDQSVKFVNNVFKNCDRRGLYTSIQDEAGIISVRKPV